MAAIFTTGFCIPWVVAVIRKSPWAKAIGAVQVAAFLYSSLISKNHGFVWWMALIWIVSLLISLRGITDTISEKSSIDTSSNSRVELKRQREITAELERQAQILAATNLQAQEQARRQAEEQARLRLQAQEQARRQAEEQARLQTEEQRAAAFTEEALHAEAFLED
ncbi:MAG: hypothetical protein ACRDAX_03300 [Propionibacteriaceae bacterium]